MLRITTESGAIYRLLPSEGLVKRTGPSEDRAEIVHANDEWHSCLRYDPPEVGRPWLILWTDGRERITTAVVKIEEV